MRILSSFSDLRTLHRHQLHEIRRKAQLQKLFKSGFMIETAKSPIGTLSNSSAPSNLPSLSRKLVQAHQALSRLLDQQHQNLHVRPLKHLIHPTLYTVSRTLPEFMFIDSFTNCEGTHRNFVDHPYNPKLLLTPIQILTTYRCHSRLVVQ